jgi:hypothetical protein
LIPANQLIKEKYKEYNGVFSKLGELLIDSHMVMTYIDKAYIINPHVGNERRER